LATLLTSAGWKATQLVVWRSGYSALASINEVNQRRARLVLRWVAVSGFNSRWGTFISVYDQPPMSTQPGHPSWVGAMSTSHRAAMLGGWGVHIHVRILMKLITGTWYKVHMTPMTFWRSCGQRSRSRIDSHGNTVNSIARELVKGF